MVLQNEQSMEQDNEHSQASKRCKLESVTQPASQLNPMVSNDTINSSSINSDHTMNTIGRKRSSHQGNAAEPWRCSHCQTDRTPQRRTGPMGPKTLCNACGVQFNKFGRLLPEYRPAASPTYIASKHSNSHKNAVEMRHREPALRAHHPAEGLGLRTHLHSAHSLRNNFFVDSSLRGSLDSIHDACTRTPNSSNFDISKFLKPNETRNINSPILMKMFTEGLHADITLTAQGGSMKAHRCVLASVSSFFATLFQNHDVKNYEMQDMSVDCLQLFLVLLYVANDGSAAMPEFEDAVDKHLVELLKACQTYDVEGRLKSILVDALSRNLSPENCWQFCNTSNISDISVPSFPPAFVCYKYILDNFDKVLESRNVVMEMKRNPELVLCFMKAYTLRFNGRSL